MPDVDNSDIEPGTNRKPPRKPRRGLQAEDAQENNTNAAPEQEGKVYKNLHKTTIFALAGRCRAGETVVLTDAEAKHFGDLVKLV